MKSIFSYRNYRVYLKDYYTWQKRETKRFTYKLFSEKAGIASPNYLKLVIDGRKNLTNAGICHFAKALGLSFHEHQYFESLVLAEQARDALEKRYYSMCSQARRRPHSATQRQINVSRFIEAWYFPAVIVALDGRAIEGAEESVAKLVGIDKIEVHRALEILLAQKLLKPIKNHYRLDSDHLLLKKGLSSIAQKRFLAAQIDFSKQMLEKEQTEGKFFSHVFTAANASLPRYVDEIDSFLKEMTVESNKEPAERVFQINAQIFPLGMAPGTVSKRKVKSRQPVDLTGE